MHNLLAIHLPAEELKEELEKANCQYHQLKRIQTAATPG